MSDPEGQLSSSRQASIRRGPQPTDSPCPAFPSISRASTSAHHLAIKFRGTHDLCMPARMSLWQRMDRDGVPMNYLSPVVLSPKSSNLRIRGAYRVFDMAGISQPASPRRAVGWDSGSWELVRYQQRSRSLLAGATVGVASAVDRFGNNVDVLITHASHNPFVQSASASLPVPACLVADVGRPVVANFGL